MEQVITTARPYKSPRPYANAMLWLYHTASDCVLVESASTVTISASSAIVQGRPGYGFRPEMPWRERIQLLQPLQLSLPGNLSALVLRYVQVLPQSDGGIRVRDATLYIEKLKQMNDR